MHPNNPELEAASRPVLRSSSDLIGASETARRDEKNIFGDILDTIKDTNWLDGVVNQPSKVESSLRGSIPVARHLEESPHRSSDSDDRHIGTIIAA